MSAYVDFFAFREAPDEARLASIRGLQAFRLYKHNAKPEWYLEDVTSQSAISFFGPLNYTPASDAARRAKQGAKALYDGIKRARLESWGLDDKRIVQGLALSCELQIPTLAVYGNAGAGVDAGFICDAGAVTYARLHALPNGVLVFENDAARVDQPDADEFDEDGEPCLDQFQFATEVANRFFSDTKRWRVNSDPDDIADYTMLLERRRR